MKRRLIAAILAVILLVLLCELHICSGEGCLFCAQIDEMRAHSVYISTSVFIICLMMSIRYFGCPAGTRKPRSKRTLIELKVELTD